MTRARLIALVAASALAAFAAHGCSPDGDPPTPKLDVGGCTAPAGADVVYSESFDGAALFVYDLIADGAGIYWQSSGVWMFTGKDGATQLDTRYASDLTVDAQNVYWRSNQSINWASKRTLGIASFTTTTYLLGLAVDATHLYYAASGAEAFDAGNATAFSITRVPLGKSGPQERLLTSRDSYGVQMSPLVAFRGALYWFDSMNGLQRLVPGDAAPVQLAAYEGEVPSRLVLDGRGAYWMYSDPATNRRHLVALTFGGDAPVVVATIDQYFYGAQLALDDAYVYFSENGNVMKLDRATGAISKAVTSGSSFAISARDIYVASQCNGQVFVTKSPK